MIFKVYKTIQKYKMLENTEKVIVGLSGGADSICLTHLLYTLSKKMNFTLEAMHINHGIRGDEAQRDEQFAEKFCNDLGIKITTKKVDVPQIAKKLKIGTEEAGRKIRYELLKKAAGDNCKTKIATAHTLSDNAETLIMRLVSGSGLRGLCGIPPVRENIIRPLIEIKRNDIENYCKANNLKYVNDSSNFQKDYTRNKIRLDIIPKLKNLNPNLEETIGRTIFSLQNDENYIEEISEEKFKSTSYEDIPHLPCAVKNRVLLKIIKSFTNERIEQKHLENLEKIIRNKKGKTYIPGGKIIAYENKTLVLGKNNSKPVRWQYLIRFLNILTEIKTNIIIELISTNEYFKNRKKYSNNAIDYDKLPKESVFRNRLPEDKFSFKKRGITKSIKKIFNEMKIPVTERETIPLLAYENEIIWAEKLGTSGKYIPNENTKKVAILKLEKQV